jgi:uncharacterized membrane protein YfhO
MVSSLCVGTVKILMILEIVFPFEWKFFLPRVRIQKPEGNNFRRSIPALFSFRDILVHTLPSIQSSLVDVVMNILFFVSEDVDFRFAVIVVVFVVVVLLAKSMTPATTIPNPIHHDEENRSYQNRYP